MPILLTTVALIFTGKPSTSFTASRRNPRRHHHPHPSPPFSNEFPINRQRRKWQRRRGINAEKEEECLLIPEANPDSNPNATSLSGVPYSLVVSGIDELYPPYELSNRNARSRTDGYWKFVERGERPPQEFTYGEFDIEFFGMLLDRTWEHYSEGLGGGDDDATIRKRPWSGKTFCDIGSGAGRLVLAAAALHPEWKVCRGLEILEGLHDMSTSIADGCRVVDAAEKQRLGISDDVLHHILRIPSNESHARSCADEGRADYLRLAPIQFTCGSFTNPYVYLGDIDCAFVFSSCMKPDVVKELSIAIGRQFKPGTIIITTEFPLFLHGSIDIEDESMPHGPYEIQLLEKVDGWCWLLGGSSTAYIHRVRTSLWEEYAGPKEMPQFSLEEEAFHLVQSIESGELTNPQEFLRKVRNDMIFHSVPQEFLPDIEDDRE